MKVAVQMKFSVVHPDCDSPESRRQSESLQKLLLLVVAFLHRSVFPQVVKRLQLSGHVLPSSDHLLDLLRVLHTLVFGERCSQTVPEVVGTFRILSSEVEELWSPRGRRTRRRRSSVSASLICSSHFRASGFTVI